jgi:WD40 repeat protein
MSRYRSALALALALAVAAPLAAQGPKPDPLPKGARVRLGDPQRGFVSARSAVPLAPGYTTFAVSDGPDAVRVFDVATTHLLDPAAKPARHFAGFYTVAVSADGKRFVNGEPPVVREVGTGKEVRRLAAGGLPAGGAAVVGHASLSADGGRAARGAAVNGRGTVTVWGVDSGEVVFAAADLWAGQAVAVLSPDGKRVAVRTTGVPAYNPGPRGEVRVYEVDGGKELFRGAATPWAAGGGIGSAAFSPDGKVLAASFGDGVVDVWDVPAGKPRPPLLGRTGQGQHVAFSPDGKALAAVAADGAVQRWAAADGKPLGTTDPPAGQIIPGGVVFAGADRVLAWGSVNACPVVWEVPSGKLLTPPLPEHTGAVRSVAFAAGGKEVVTAGHDGRVVRWDAATGKPLGSVALRPVATRALAGRRLFVNLVPDGSRAVAAVAPAAVIDLATGAEEFTLPGPAAAGPLDAVTLSAGGTHAAVVTSPLDQRKPATCAVWDLVGRRRLAEVEVPRAAGLPLCAAVSPSGKRLVTAAFAPDPPRGKTQALVVTGWDVATGRQLARAEDPEGRYDAVVAAANETSAVVSSSGGRLRAFDYERGVVGDELEPEAQVGGWRAGSLAFSPDGRRLAAAAPSADPGAFPVKLYDWPSGRVLRALTGHRGPVTALAFSADGKTLASGSEDTTVLLWDVAAVK